MGFIRRIAIGLEELESPSERPVHESEQKETEGLSVKRLMELIEQEA